MFKGEDCVEELCRSFFFSHSVRFGWRDASDVELGLIGEWRDGAKASVVRCEKRRLILFYLVGSPLYALRR